MTGCGLVRTERRVAAEVSTSTSSGPLGFLPTREAGSAGNLRRRATKPSRPGRGGRSTPRAAPKGRSAPAPASGLATVRLPSALKRRSRRAAPTNPERPVGSRPGRADRRARARRWSRQPGPLPGNPKRRDHPWRTPEISRHAERFGVVLLPHRRRAPLAARHLPRGTSRSSSATNFAAPGVRPRGYTPKQAATHGREPGRCGTTCGGPRCSPQIHTISPLPGPDQGRVSGEPSRLGNGSSRHDVVARRRGALQQARLSRRPCDAASGRPQ